MMARQRVQVWPLALVVSLVLERTERRRSRASVFVVGSLNRKVRLVSTARPVAWGVGTP